MKQGWKQCLAASIAFAIGAAAAAEGQAPGVKPLVVNGDLSLTTLDFDAYMERVPPARRNEFRAEYEKINPTVDALWIRRVLAQRAREAGMDRDPLMGARLRLAQEDLLAEAYLAKFGCDVKVPNLEPRARELYQANQKEFKTPELVTVEHILVNTKRRSRADAEKLVNEAYERAKGGESLVALSSTHSDEPGSREIFDAPITLFEKPLPDVLAKLKIGELSMPVETQYGFHMVRLVKRTPSRQKTYAEVRDELIAVEKQKYIDEARTAMVEEVRADPKNFLHLDNVRGLKTEFKPPVAAQAGRQAAPKAQ